MKGNIRNRHIEGRDFGAVFRFWFFFLVKYLVTPKQQGFYGNSELLEKKVLLQICTEASKYVVTCSQYR